MWRRMKFSLCLLVPFHVEHLVRPCQPLQLNIRGVVLDVRITIDLAGSPSQISIDPTQAIDRFLVKDSARVDLVSGERLAWGATGTIVDAQHTAALVPEPGRLLGEGVALLTLGLILRRRSRG